MHSLVEKGNQTLPVEMIVDYSGGNGDRRSVTGAPAGRPLIGGGSFLFFEIEAVLHVGDEIGVGFAYLVDEILAFG